jgi:drug/metabolite transporter superfamily protein YnfA
MKITLLSMATALTEITGSYVPWLCSRNNAIDNLTVMGEAQGLGTWTSVPSR